jgi:uncharacterized protein YaaN involved in tellurite resistance
MDQNSEKTVIVQEQGAAPAAIVPDLSFPLAPAGARPKWMAEVVEGEVREGVRKFMLSIKENPTDIRLTTQVYKLGESGSKELLPHTALYERKISVVMKESQDGSPTNKSLLQIKQELDQINPAILANQPIPVKVLVFFSKSRLPKAQEVLDMIYAKRETVMSTVNGIKEGLWETKDRLLANLTDIATIYDGLVKGHQLLERDIYFGELLREELTAFVAQTDDPVAKQNLEQVLADLTTAVINLRSEETANQLFFAGAQKLAQVTNMQISNITGIVRLLERSVLANLGLRVASAEIAESVNVTEQLKHSIGQTILDTTKQIGDTADKMNQARSSALINMESLEQSCVAMEEMYAKQAAANKMVIEVGGQTAAKLKELSGRLRKRVEGEQGVTTPLLSREGGAA